MTTAVPIDSSSPPTPDPRRHHDHHPQCPAARELTFTLPASAGRVWEAIATAEGISSWFLPTETIETRDGVVGSVLRMHMGEGSFSDATITGWGAPRRLVYSEPGWASLAGHDDAATTPMITEFLVEAQSGGTCVPRAVTSAFGTGRSGSASSSIT